MNSSAHAAGHATDYAADLGRYIFASPSSYHAVSEAARMLIAAGFTQLSEREAWRDVSGKRFVIRDGALIAWQAPPGIPVGAGFRIVGAHTDSPGFKVKQDPTFGHLGWRQLAVEVYGGPLVHSWLDRDLRVAGRLVDRGGRALLVESGPVARIPSLAIHLDRDMAAGVTLDRQRHTQPVLDLDSEGGAELVQALAQDAGMAPDDVAGFDLYLADTQAPAAIGLGGDLLAAGRLDNLSSTFAALRALIRASDHGDGTGFMSIVALFDHEEVGSASSSGAAGPVLEDTVRRIAVGLGLGEDEYRAALAASICVSADAGHGIHPNYPERHDPTQWPHLGAGPMLKVNANQRYASDGIGAALWRGWCDAANVTTQAFVSNNAIPCGSTIGPITATRLGIRTIDVGVPLLSMHSIRELAHADDLQGLALVLQEFLTGAS
ncbi:M18 family aminopeptidase [Rarobacter faecitabidus]|nr:M18 family aminopeptidase [Rarobacter faecitabidus]